MEYSKTDEEFYRIISQKLEEIYSLSVPFEKKRELQYMTYETMWNYLESKNRELETEANFAKFKEGLSLLEDSVYLLRDNMKRIHDNAKIALINAQLATAKMRDSLKRINETKGKIEMTTKGLLHKFDARNTLLDITLGMTNQKKN